MITLLVLYLVTGLLLVGLSLPLIYRKVPPNYWYGFRVRATLENEEVWYPANEYAGKRLFWVLGIDMAHMGRRYGDRFEARAGAGTLAEVERRDRQRIDSAVPK